MIALALMDFQLSLDLNLPHVPVRVHAGRNIRFQLSLDLNSVSLCIRWVPQRRFSFQLSLDLNPPQRLRVPRLPGVGLSTISRFKPS